MSDSCARPRWARALAFHRERMTEFANELTETPSALLESLEHMRQHLDHMALILSGRLDV